MIVVGCGAVGVEFASIFRTFGSDVTLLEALPRVVPLEDEEISAELHKALTKKGMKIELEAKVESVKKDANGATVTYKNKAGQSVAIAPKRFSSPSAAARSPKILASRKPRPNSSAASSTPTHISETAEPHLYAIGDIVAGLPQLAHAASMEGIIAVGRMAGKEVQPFDRKRCPNCHLLRAADRFHRPHRETSSRSWLQRENWKISVPRQ